MGGFFDDDLDLEDETLQELERSALASTQLARQRRPLQMPVRGIGNKSQAGSANCGLRWRPPQPKKWPQPAPPSAPPASAPDPPSSDYGFDDEDVVDLDEPWTVIQPAASNPRPAVASSSRPPVTLVAPRRGSKPPLDPETEAAFAAADAELGVDTTGQWQHAPYLQPKADDNIDVSSLAARIAELEAEQARLKQAEQDARNAALAKQGEIAIVRANQDKATKEYERRIAVMQKLHADEAAKHKAELEAGRKEREKMATDNRFLQHDLAQEAEKARRLTGPGKARISATGKERATPAAPKRMGLGDGFDDEEVRVPTPSKSRERAKYATPKHGAKRRRTAPDSPVAVLSFTQPAVPSVNASIEQPPASTELLQTSVHTEADERYKFMQRLLLYSRFEGHERVMEALARHTLPSSARRSMSAVVMDDLTRPAPIKEADHLPLKVARASLKLWSQCLADKQYAPLYLVYDLLHFALYLERSSTASQLIEQAMPLCIKTIDLVAVPLARASTNLGFKATLDVPALQKLAEEVDVDEVLDILLRLCQAASLNGDRLEVFWRHMDFHCTLLTLNKALPISQISTALKILALSPLTTTFGPISADGETQPQHETGLVDRLTCLLFEIPEVPPTEPAYTEAEIASLRIEMLKVFRTMCETEHGGLLLAQHRSAIGRLVRFLDGQINRLYTTPTAKRDSDELSAHDLIATTSNLTLRLIYHLFRTYDSVIDITQKLNVVKGGYHKFLISMTRIAFSEQLVLEHGIEDEVVEAAHAILDNVLSPEEGQAIVQAVETPRGTKRSVRGVAEEGGDGTEEAEEQIQYERMEDVG